MDYEEIPQPVTDDEEEEEEEEEDEEEEESETESTAATGGGKLEFYSILFRFVLVLLFPVIAFVSISFLIGIVAVFVGELSITNPVSVPSQCRIVTSSVDLRSSKVCELGLLNYKAKNVFYPFETNKFRCRYDYYWASVFKVEYKDHSLGQTKVALAEAPDEALPLNCRPNFGGAWLTKDKFKVNQTYDCWYTYGISKVSLYRDGFFSCQAKEPLKIEMSRRYSILFIKILRSWFFNKTQTKSVSFGVLAGVVSGFLTSIITVFLISAARHIKPGFLHFHVIGAIKTIWFRRACLLVAYISFTCWLVIQYAKLIGLPTSLAEYKS